MTSADKLSASKGVNLNQLHSRLVLEVKLDMQIAEHDRLQAAEQAVIGDVKELRHNLVEELTSLAIFLWNPISSLPKQSLALWLDFWHLCPDVDDPDRELTLTVFTLWNSLRLTAVKGIITMEKACGRLQAPSCPRHVMEDLTPQEEIRKIQGEVRVLLYDHV